MGKGIRVKGLCPNARWLESSEVLPLLRGRRFGFGPIEEDVGAEQSMMGAPMRGRKVPRGRDAEEEGGKDEAEADPGRDFERDCDDRGEDGREEEGGEDENHALSSSK
jgi:hypothetical protein